MDHSKNNVKGFSLVTALEWNVSVQSSPPVAVVRAGGHGIFTLVMAGWQGSVERFCSL
jgi:hypothetical protein